VISHKLLGTNNWFVINHTNCGMEFFTNDIIADLLDKSLDTATLDHSNWLDHGNSQGSREGHFINWLTIKNQTQSIIEDVKRIKNHPKM
jgi:carbonic anhydrase